MTQDKLLIICGPTATGKTKLASHLAKEFCGELVSADSRQVYRGMDIGTGKDAGETGGVPIWMIDVVRPDEEFSISHYSRQARAIIRDIRSRRNLPIVVGGTGLYIKSLIGAIETINIPPDPVLRKKLEKLSVANQQRLLQSLGKELFEGMNESDRANPRRLIRKIEIAGYTKHADVSHGPASENTLTIGLTAPLSHLYQLVDARVIARVKQGSPAEVQRLLDEGYTWELPAMSAMGYREWRGFIDAAPDQQSRMLETVVGQWQHHEHAYVRRQMTWFRKMPQVTWFDIREPDMTVQVTRKVAKWYTTGKTHED